MTKTEKISIIVPIYNVELYLSKCIDSILNQTYHNIEIILVEDGSPDNCDNICDKYAKMDSRIKVIHKKNGGLSDARNRGIEVATGKYLSFVDSDDYIDPKMIEQLYQNLKQNQADISICNVYKVYPNGNLIHEKLLNSNLVIRDDQKFNNIYNEYCTVTVPAWCKLYKKEIFKNIRYPFGKTHEDEAIIFKVLNQASVISYFDEPLYYYVQREGSIMSGFQLKRLDIIPIHKERLHFLKGNKNLLKLEYKSYIQVLIKTIIPGLHSIKEQEKASYYLNEAKKLSNNMLSEFPLTFKEKIKFNCIKHIPKIYIKLTTHL